MPGSISRWIWIALACSVIGPAGGLAGAQTSQPPAKPGPGLAEPSTSRNAMLDAMEKQRAAAAVQREAVRQQVEMAAQWRASAPALSAAPEEPAAEVPGADCNPIADVELTPLIDAAAQTRALQPKLLRAVIEQESGLRPCAVSPKGAQGLMQLMPETASQFDVQDPFDPKQNIEAGAAFLKQLLDKYKGDIPLALGAYNAGPTTVDKSGGVPGIPETRDYVDAIMRKLSQPGPAEPRPPGNAGSR